MLASSVQPGAARASREHSEEADPEASVGFFVSPQNVGVPQKGGLIACARRPSEETRILSPAKAQAAPSVRTRARGMSCHAVRICS